jgi:putative membrane protein
MSIIAILIGLVIGILVSSIIIWIVGKLGLGMEVSGFGPAILAAIVIGVLNAVVTLILSALGITIPSGGVLGAIVHLVISAIVILTAGSWIRGLRVNGFFGGAIAAVAISAVGWLLTWLLGLVIK